MKQEFLEIGATLVTPYFNFLQPSDFCRGDEDKTLTAKAENFLIKSKVALQYYRSNRLLDIFDSMYIVGNNNPKSVGDYSVGSTSQRNDAHFIEFIGALAAADFFSNQHKSKPVKLAARKSPSTINWEDLPNHTISKQKLANFLRFAFVFLGQYYPIIKDSTSIRPYKIPWLVDFIGRRFGDAEMQLIAKFSDYLKSFLLWIAQMQNSASQELSMVNWKLFAHRPDSKVQLLDDLKMSNLQDLVIGIEGYDMLATREIWHELCSMRGNGLLDFILGLYRACQAKVIER